MLSLRDLGFAHAGRRVFSGWSAEIEPGVTWVVGDDGSGKTTLLALIAGALQGSGTVAVDGVALDGPAPRPAVAWCDARDEAVDTLTVAAFLDRLRAAAPAFDDAVLQRHVAGFDLAPHLGKAMFQLSTGTRRKIGLAGVFAVRAPVLLLDDPTAALDGPSVAHLMRALADADRDASRHCLVTAYAAPPGATRTLALPPRA